MNNLQLVIESLLFTLYVQNSIAESDDVYYVANFNDEVKDCDGFQNDFFKCNDLTVGIINGESDGEDSLGLSGRLDLLADIIDEYTIDLKVWKETDLAKEFMYTVSGNLCASLQKEDTPWWPLVQGLKATECPIKTGEYPIENMAMSLDFAKDVLRHEFVGDYEIELSILDLTETQLSCHIISVGISEKTKE
ncbi:uncharacterized protein LOC124531955 [Vanessa cardui]|uniref:uncharacterized protein LOC124531955 n=1 Tax=Vanessa cardui TaxID=171605 RepID=UPI001F12C200|nr:uncharacterized protein LOC124531955 [Vanessa cardui]